MKVVGGHCISPFGFSSIPMFFFFPFSYPPLLHIVRETIFSFFGLCLFLSFTFGALYDVAEGVWFRISLIFFFRVGGYLDVSFFATGAEYGGAF